MIENTVALVIDNERGDKISSEDLNLMTEDEYRALRRSAASSYKEKNNRDYHPRLICALCHIPVYISDRHKEDGNRWFSHKSSGEDIHLGCPYRKKNLSPKERNALIFQGQKEGREHIRIKHFIADWVEQDLYCHKPVVRDKSYHSQVGDNDWKKPDVYVEWKDKKLVFEIQLSYTYLSEVTSRDSFYKKEKVHIIWIFKTFEPNRSITKDEFYHNRHNLFVLDKEAEEETCKRKKLTFKCYYLDKVNDSLPDAVWEFVELSQLNYPELEYRPYFKTYNQFFIESSIDQVRKDFIQSILAWSIAITESQDNSIIDFEKKKVRNYWHKLCKQANYTVPERFYEWFFLEKILPRILTMKFDKPIGYRLDTVWQVLNATLNMKSRSKLPFTILYLISYSYYKPKELSNHHKEIINKFRTEVIEAIKSGDDKYHRDTLYDDAVELVFPELKDKLNKTFGRQREY